MSEGTGIAENLATWEQIDPEPADEARPRLCPACGVAGVDPWTGRVNVQGHGVRWRPAIGWRDAGPRVALIGVRRFLCTECGVTCSVAPVVIVPRYLYTLAAVLGAWFVRAEAPIGDGFGESEAP